jgi:hypothetical protein
MALFDKLIPIRTPCAVATAIRAISAIRSSDTREEIAEIAEIAVANSKHGEMAVAEIAEIAVASATPDETPQQKQRRQKVTKMLADSPHLNHVMLVDDTDADPDYHIVAFAVRDEHGGATSELLIPRAKVDIWQLMEFIQQRGQVQNNN